LYNKTNKQEQAPSTKLLNAATIVFIIRIAKLLAKQEQATRTYMRNKWQQTASTTTDNAQATHTIKNQKTYLFSYDCSRLPFFILFF
jgi:hypothetical protein